MKTKRFLWIGLLLGIVPAALQAADFSSWGKQMEITFPGYSGERESLTDFPALIVFRDGNNGVDFNEFNPEGADLRFSDHTRTNELNYEIEAWNDAGSNSWVWVQVPELTSNTIIHAFWDHPEATKPAYTTNGATWGNGYDAVWHLDSGGEDASANNRDAVNSGATPGEGIIAGAHSFWDTYLDTPALPLNMSFTITMWIRPNTLYNYGDAFGYEGRMSLVTYSNGDIKFYVGDGSWGSPVEAANALADETWHYIAATYDGSHTRMLVDDTWYGPVANTKSIGEIPVYIGGRRTKDYWFHGAIDEVRLSNAPRSDDWTWACRMNRISNETFAVQGPATAQTWPEVATLPPENITETSAELTGYLSRTGGTATAVHFFWGTTDGGTNAAQWAEEAVLPAPQAIGPVSTNVTLVSGNEYYVRCAASNEAGLVWAPETKYFLSSPVTVTVFPATIGEAWETATFTFSRSAIVTGMPVTVNFTNNGTATPKSDYTGLETLSAVILAGESNATVSVTSILDAYPEGDETLVLSLTEGLYAIGSPAQATLTLTNTAVALTNTWTGNGDGIDWFDAENWSGGKPILGQEMTVMSGNILLTNKTIDLTSFTMSGGTLTFSNWTTRLQADTVTVSGGTLTLPPAFTEQQMSNRVWIVCSNLTLGVDAKIDANERGYAPGWGPGRKNTYGGTAHGGYGFIGGFWDQINHPYGSASAPTVPGSGGMGSYPGPGGGAIRIDAEDEVTIHGAISADSGIAAAHSSSTVGSGGSIYIRCRVFSGSETGLISANGGQSRGAYRPSGGRIAVVYSATDQKNMVPVNPGVRFDLRRGRDREAYPGTGLPSIFAEPGTLYLPDTQFLSATMGTQWNDVRFVIPDVEEWQVNDLQINGWVAFDPPMRRIRVDGNMVLNSNSRLTLYSMPTNEATASFGLFLDVDGDLIVHENATMDLISNPTNGAVPYVECGAFYLNSGGVVMAERHGYNYSTGPSWATIAAPNGGGGYGGRGGGTTEDRGKVYGSQYFPIQPGSGGSAQSGGPGGGLVWIGARGPMRVDGIVQADGMFSAIHSTSRAGSGGAILLTARKFTGTGELRAQGGHGRGFGGGGGRIAVWTPFISFDAMRELAEREHSSSVVEVLDPGVHWPDLTLNVDPADGPYGVDSTAGTGTIFLGALRLGTVFMIK